MWKIICYLLYSFIFYVLCDGTYECGDHGRFEYCIDEIPGCVVGCHCHPGYYFDTDTKICEPNSKLIEHHRRHYVATPSQVQNNIMTPNSIFITNTVATTSKIDGAVDEISKDADDLGDWLYNQFFKTIENQVLNTTKDNALTRRSGSVSSIKKRKKRKKTKKRGKNKKKDNLKKKLLRITENDSVFDLSSSSNSDSSGSTSDSSDSSEYDRYHHDDDDEHGHKKIVMIKKKPKQSLPNFIFLPNLETPFYPPLGLPPPPVQMPMYPMVPVPPMMPYAHAECDDSDEKTTAAPNKTTSLSTTTISTTIHEEHTEPAEREPEHEPEQEPANVDDSPAAALRRPIQKRKKNVKISKNTGTGNDLRSSKLGSPSRQKILQKLGIKMQNQASKSLIPPWKKNNKIISGENMPDSYTINDVISNPKEVNDNVDFKYISDLIHRVDQNNKSNNLPPIEYNPLDSIEVYQPSIQRDKFSDYVIPPNAPASRRFDRSNIHPADEYYYTNLGRQIASMIRGIDTENKEVNIKLETTNDIPRNDLYFNVNSPRSYWERSVRSPLTFLKSNRNKFEYLKKSNELLFDIENKVEIIASTTPTLTLREIENIVSIMETAKRDMQNRHVIKEPSGKNFNINLWPQDSTNFKKIMRIAKLQEVHNVIGVPLKELKANKSHAKENKSPNNLQQFSMMSADRFESQRYPLISETKSEPKPVSYFTGRTINYYQIPQQTFHNEKHIQPTFSEQNSRKSLWGHERRPTFLKQRKYFGNSQNFFVHQNENLSYLEPKKGLKKPQISYFHHEVNNFDNIV